LASLTRRGKETGFAPKRKLKPPIETCGGPNGGSSNNGRITLAVEKEGRSEKGEDGRDPALLRRSPNKSHHRGRKRRRWPGDGGKDVEKRLTSARVASNHQQQSSGLEEIGGR